MKGRKRNKPKNLIEMRDGTYIYYGFRKPKQIKTVYRKTGEADMSNTILNNRNVKIIDRQSDLFADAYKYRQDYRRNRFYFTRAFNQ